ELGWECVAAGEDLALTQSREQGWRLCREGAGVPAPMVLTLTSAGELPNFPIAGFLRAMGAELTVVQPEDAKLTKPDGRLPQSATVTYALAAAPAPSGDGLGGPVTPDDAVRVLLERIGVGTARADREPYTGPIRQAAPTPALASEH